MKHRIPEVVRTFVLCSITFSCAILFAADVDSISSNEFGQSWDTGEDWSDGNPATAGNDYFITSGTTIRTPEISGNFNFPGDSLTLESGGRLALKNRSPIVVDLISTGGRISHFSTGLNPNISVIQGTVTLDNDLNLDGIADRSIRLESAISGSGGLVKRDEGSLILSSASNTYTGDLAILDGTVRLDSGDNRLSTASGLLIASGSDAGATLDLNGFDQTLSRLSSSVDNASGNLTITGGANSKLTINTSSNTQLGPGGTLSANPRDVVTDMSGLGEFVWNGSGHIFRVGYLSGTGNSSGVSGTATAHLADSNTITAFALRVGDVAGNSSGGTSLLRLGETNQINTDRFEIGDSARSNATLNFRDGLGGAPTVTIRGTDGSSAVTTFDVGRVSTFNTATWTAEVDFSGGQLDALVDTLRVGIADSGSSSNRSGVQDSTFTMGQGSLEVDTLIVGQLAGGGTTDDTFTANGTFTLNHANGTVSAGDLILGTKNSSATVLGGTRTANGTFNLQSGTLEAATIGRGDQIGVGNTTQNFNFSGGTIRNASGGDLTVSDVPINLTGSGTRNFEATSGQAITVNSVVGGAGGFTKAGDGILTLAGNNTYSGATSVDAGVLEIGDGSATNGTLGNNSDTAVATGAILRIRRTGTAGDALAYGGTLSGNGTVEIASGARFDFTANQGSSNSLIFDVDGTLAVRTSVGVTSVELGELSGDGTVARGAAASGAATVSIGGKNTDSTFSGQIISDQLSIEKVGTGTLTLSGNNTYTGTTTVTAGTLLIDGDHSAATGDLTVAAGATLGGSGIIGGTTTINGIHDPGNSPGIQNFTNLTYNAGSKIEWELIDNTTSGPGTNFDRIMVSGNLDFAGATTLELDFNSIDGSSVDWDSSFWGLHNIREWQIWGVTGASAPTFSGLPGGLDDISITFRDSANDGSSDPFSPGGNVPSSADFYLFQSGNSIYLRYEALPEPATFSLLGLLMGTLTVLTRRRRRLQCDRAE